MTACAGSVKVTWKMFCKWKRFVDVYPVMTIELSEQKSSSPKTLWIPCPQATPLSRILAAFWPSFWEGSVVSHGVGDSWWYKAMSQRQRAHNSTEKNRYINKLLPFDPFWFYKQWTSNICPSEDVGSNSMSNRYPNFQNPWISCPLHVL
jgi:hypothetical protein